MVTYVGSSVLWRVSLALVQIEAGLQFPTKMGDPYVRLNGLTPKGCGSSVLRNLGTSYMRAHNMRNNKLILYGDQTRCEADFTPSTANVDLR